MKKLTILFVLVLLFPFTSALFGEIRNFGYNQIDIPTTTTSTTTNYSSVNVNNSLYWQGHTGTDGSWLTGIEFNYNHTSAVYTLWNTIWSSTYNATYDKWAYNQTLAAFTYFYNKTSNINATNYNVTADYFFGKPLQGMLGSGLIASSEGTGTKVKDINVTCVGLTCSYNAFEVRITSGDVSSPAVYCEIPAGSLNVPNNTNAMYYVDRNCAVQQTTYDTWFTTTLGGGGVWDFANILTHSDTAEVIDTISLEERRLMKARVLNYYEWQGKVLQGMNIQFNAWNSFNITEGKYVYGMDVVSTNHHEINESDELEVVGHLDSTTTWTFVDHTGLNVTSCDNGTTIIACTGSNYRRHFIFIIGYDTSSGESEVHQLFPSISRDYSTLAQCLDTTTSPLTYTLPTEYLGATVMLYAYCAKRTDTSWTSANLIDLRTIKTGSATATTVDTSNFVPYTGATKDVNITVYNFITQQNVTVWNKLCNATSCFSFEELNASSSGGEGNVTWNESHANDLYVTNASLLIEGLRVGLNMTNNDTYRDTTNNWNGNYSILIGAVNNASYLDTSNATYLATTNAWNGNYTRLNGCVDNSSYLDRSNATYLATTNAWNGNYTKIVYINKTNEGSLNISDDVMIFKHLSVGNDKLLSNSVAISQWETYKGTEQYLGIQVWDYINSSSYKTTNNIGIGGYLVPVGENYSNGVLFAGLSFGPTTYLGSAGNFSIKSRGIETWGAGSVLSNYKVGNVEGLYVQAFADKYGGNFTIDNATGIYIGDYESWGVYKPQIRNYYMMQIEQPGTSGAAGSPTNRYQMLLKGRGVGTGIWFNSTTGPRIWAINDTALNVSAPTVWFSDTITAQTVVDRSSEYDKNKYGDASQYLNDVSSRATIIKSDGTLEYNHLADPEFLQDKQSYPCNCRYEEKCSLIPKEYTLINGTVLNDVFNNCIQTEVCDDCEVIGRDMGATLSWLRQVNYEQQQEIKLLKEELCKKDFTYSFCI